MPPTDASTEASPHATTDTGTASAPGNEDTLELRLTDDFLTLLSEDTGSEESDPCDGGTDAGLRGRPANGELLDHLADWGPVPTPAGTLHLAPVRLGRDVPLISRWMNDSAVDSYWKLGGAEDVTANHLRAQLSGDGRSMPCLGLLNGTPVSYWEIYRADLDPLARHYPARPHDTGIHLLIGPVAQRGRGLGSTLLRAVADLILDRRPSCARVVAEPDLRNFPSVSAFLSAGFRYSTEVDLPDKRAALMCRDRLLRDLM